MSSCEISREDFPFVETATFPVELIPSICSPPIAVKQEFTSTPAFCSASSIALRIAPEAASIFTMFPFRRPADFSHQVPATLSFLVSSSISPIATLMLLVPISRPTIICYNPPVRQRFLYETAPYLKSTSETFESMELTTSNTTIIYFNASSFNVRSVRTLIFEPSGISISS